MRIWIAATAAVLLGSSALVASEQRREADLEEARARFVAGQAAVESGRWADAVDDFRRAYELSEVPAALYNVGFALRALGRHREARDVFERLLGRHADMDATLREEAQRFRREAAARVVALELVGLDPGVTHAIRFDGRPVPDEGQRPVAIEGDPGTHALTVRREGHEPFVWEGALRDGERREIAIELLPVGAGGGGGGGVDEGGGVLSSPIFWVVVGAALIGGGVAAFLVIQGGGQLEPNSDRVVEL
jgi:tetratricopeptide (TPR) repeat protein